MLNASRDVLLKRARCGTVASDIPGFLEEEESDEEGSDPPTPEHALVNKTKKDFRSQLWSELDGIYRELDSHGYQQTRSLVRLRSRIEALATEDNFKYLIRQIAEERAGLRTPPIPEDLKARPPGERYWRLWTAVGDRYEQFLGSVLGAERARAGRHERAGWSKKVLYDGTCPPGDG
jgi:hypothetical protein